VRSGPAVLGRLRDELLAEVLGGLRADPEVAGVALVGSLGRGAGDNWSDVDLLVLMDGRAVARFAEERAPSWWWTGGTTHRYRGRPERPGVGVAR
jgi:predicted nucleotidyltransferase